MSVDAHHSIFRIRCILRTRLGHPIRFVAVSDTLSISDLLNECTISKCMHWWVVGSFSDIKNLQNITYLCVEHVREERTTPELRGKFWDFGTCRMERGSNAWLDYLLLVYLWWNWKQNCICFVWGQKMKMLCMAFGLLTFDKLFKSELLLLYNLMRSKYCMLSHYFNVSESINCALISLHRPSLCFYLYVTICMEICALT